jgi:hypothetical protein
MHIKDNLVVQGKKVQAVQLMAMCVMVIVERVLAQVPEQGQDSGVLRERRIVRVPIQNDLAVRVNRIHCKLL